MKRKLLSWIMVCMMVVGLIPMKGGTVAFADTVTYAVEGGNLYFDPETGTITGCDKSVTGDLVIPSEIEGISVTIIGREAFHNCGLTRITIPEGMKGIGDYAFWGCTKLTNITIPEGVRSIGNGAFWTCTHLTNITIPEGVMSIGEGTFSGCTNLTSITIPEGVRSIGSSVFSGCTNLTSVTIPEGISNLGDGFFSGCTKLTSITIPVSVTNIGDDAFYNCSSLTSITIPDGVKIIGNRAFRKCSGLTKISIPSSVTQFEGHTFDECINLSQIDVDTQNPIYCSLDGILYNKDKTMILRYPEGKTGISYVIPESVISIGGGAFKQCSSLLSVAIPSSVTRIDYGAFEDCYSLYDGDVYYTGSETNWNSISIGDKNDPLLSASIHYNSTGSTGSSEPVVVVEYTKRTVCIVWDDENNKAGKRPGELKVTLSPIGKSVTLNEANQWKATIGNLWKYDDNKKVIDYQWIEGEMVDGYSLKSQTTEQQTDGCVTTITNTYKENLPSFNTEATVKKVWSDENNKEKNRPVELKVELMTNGVASGREVTLNESNDWSCTIKELPVQSSDGMEITYSWKEDDVPEGYKLTSVAVDGTITTLTNEYKPSDPTKYTVSTTTDGKGIVTGEGEYSNGSSVTLKATPAEGYEFAGWYNGDKLLSKNTSYTFIVTEAVKIVANFTEMVTKNPSDEPSDLPTDANPFTDVQESDYFFDAIKWAVQNLITNGTSKTTFSPDDACTRAQMVTFLWRAKGSPEPSSSNNPFVDVESGSYYEKAVLWAAEQKITTGTSDTSFSPDATVSRDQTVTFLWRMEGSVTVTVDNPFTDVAAGQYYTDAVLWAVKNQITTGKTETLFGPADSCTRGQIVTFLYRDMA